MVSKSLQYWKGLLSCTPEWSSKSRSSEVTRSYTEGCRAFFDEYAKENDIDPLNPDSWYFNLQKVMKKKVRTMVV